MKDWRPFDIKSFLKASRHWDDEIKRLQEERDNLSELPATGNSPGKSSDVSDLTASVALRRLKITAQIDEIRLYKEMLDFALKTLTEDERRLVDGFFFPVRMSIGSFVWEYGREHGLSRRGMYSERERVLNKMGNAILTRYYK